MTYHGDPEFAADWPDNPLHAWEPDDDRPTRAEAERDREQAHEPEPFDWPEELGAWLRDPSEEQLRAEEKARREIGEAPC